MLSYTLSLWTLLRLSGESVLSKVVYALATLLTPLVCQSFLILPKVAPLLHNDLRDFFICIKLHHISLYCANSKAAIIGSCAWL